MEMKQKFVINAFFYGIILLIVALTYQYIVPILMPFLIGFCVAFIVHTIQRKLPSGSGRYERMLAVFLCIAFYVIVLGLLVLVGITAVDRIIEFAQALPDLFYGNIYPFFIQAGDWLEEKLAPFDPDVVDWIIDLGKTIAQNLGQFATDLSASLVKWVAGIATSLPNMVIQIVLTVVSSFYFSVDYNKVLWFLLRLIPNSKRGMTMDTLRYARSAVVVYIRSYAILFSITFLELAVGLLIMRIPYAVLIALAIAIFDLMPVLGTGGILLPWTVILLVMGRWPMAIGMLALYIVITAVRNSIEPRLVGDRIGLHPLATLIAMILGLRLVGLLGMFCFPVGLVVIMNLKKKPEPQTEAN